MSRKYILLLGFTGLLFSITLVILGTLGTPKIVTAQSAATPIPGVDAWTQPTTLLPRASAPDAAVSPDGYTSYCSGSKAWGVVVGAEDRGWKAGNYIKVAGQGQNVKCVFDTSGTLHLVWDDEGRVWYSKLFRDGTSSEPRNLSRETLNADQAAIGPNIAYARLTNRLFITFFSNPDTPGGDATRYFSESADQGSTWSTAYIFDRDNGYRPVAPVVGVDQSTGMPTLLYGKMTEAQSRILAIHREDGGGWSGPLQVSVTPGGSQFFLRLVSPYQGGLFATWIEETSPGGADKAVKVSHQLPTGNWQTPVAAGTGGHYLGSSSLTVGTNGYVWVGWIDPDNGVQLRYAVSTDSGNTFGSVRVAFVGKDLFYSRLGWFTMVTTPLTKRVRIIQEVSQDNPIYLQAETIILAEIEEKTVTAPFPTPAPPAAPGASPTATNSMPPTVVGAGVDSSEPDNTLALAQAKGILLVPNTTAQVHSLYDPKSPDRNRDTDVILFEGKADKLYTLIGTGNGNKNFQLKLSVYVVGNTANGNVLTLKNPGSQPSTTSSNWLGTATECNGDKRQACFTFKAKVNGIYYVQVSNFLEGNGSPNDVYSIKLLEEDNPPVTVTTTASTVTSLPITNTPFNTPTNTPFNTATITPLPDTLASPPTTTLPTATPIPTRANPTGGISGNGDLPAGGNNNSGMGQQVLPTSTPKPTLTLSEGEVQATQTATHARATEDAYQEKAREAALTPQIIALAPYSPVAHGGEGPLLAPPDATLKALPTLTKAPPATNAAKSSPSMSPNPVKIGAGTKSNPKPGMVIPPAKFGDWWMVPIALLILGKAILNFMSSKKRKPNTKVPKKIPAKP